MFVEKQFNHKINKFTQLLERPYQVFGALAVKNNKMFKFKTFKYDYFSRV